MGFTVWTDGPTTSILHSFFYWNDELLLQVSFAPCLRSFCLSARLEYHFFDLVNINVHNSIFFGFFFWKSNNIKWWKLPGWLRVMPLWNHSEQTVRFNLVCEIFWLESGLGPLGKYYFFEWFLLFCRLTVNALWTQNQLQTLMLWTKILAAAMTLAFGYFYWPFDS